MSCLVIFWYERKLEERALEVCNSFGAYGLACDNLNGSFRYCN